MSVIIGKLTEKQGYKPRPLVTAFGYPHNSSDRPPQLWSAEWMGDETDAAHIANKAFMLANHGDVFLKTGEKPHIMAIFIRFQDGSQRLFARRPDGITEIMRGEPQPVAAPVPKPLIIKG